MNRLSRMEIRLRVGTGDPALDGTTSIDSIETVLRRRSQIGNSSSDSAEEEGTSSRNRFCLVCNGRPSNSFEAIALTCQSNRAAAAASFLLRMDNILLRDSDFTVIVL